MSVLFAPAAPAVVLPPGVFDLQLSGSVGVPPDPAGVTTGYEMSHNLTLINRSEIEVPAGVAAISMSVPRAGVRNDSQIVVTGLTSSGFSSGGGNCFIGATTRSVVCTTTEAISPGGTAQLTIRYRHRQEENRDLSFFAQALVIDGVSIDPNAGNNSYGGPTYSFAGSTTTTTEPTTTTTEPTTTTTEEPTTTTEEPTTTTEESTTTIEETTTTLEETTTTEEATTTTEPPTTVTAAPETSPPTTAGTTTTAAATLLATSDDEQSGVLGATGTADTDPPAGDEALLPLSPEAEDDGGLPLLPLLAIVILALLIAGGTLAYYRFWEDEPPLVDIRQYH